jgi:ABC-type transport system substrate-binding protein
VQGIDNVYSMDFAAVQDDPNLALMPRPPLNTFYIGLNNNQPPLDNEKVRQALAMGIDRALLIENSFPPGYEVASFFAPCALPNACVGEPWYDFDPAAARDLLAEAGYLDGFQLELAYRDVVRSYLPRPARVAKELQTQLQKNLNVQVKLKAMDSQEYLQAVDAGTLTGLFLLGWGADYPDVSNFLDFNFGSQAPPQFGKPYDDLVDTLQKGAAHFGDEARQPYYEAANLLIRQHVPAIPVSHGGWALPDDLAIAYARTVEGAHASPLGLENFSRVQVPGQDTFIWMQAAEPRSLYCADETEVESLRVCAQIIETLYRYETGGVAVQPGLAEVCEPSPDLMVWNCSLRQGVLFQDGSTLDANDVVLSFAVQWDAASPLHKGNSGNFAYFKSFWGAFMNSPQP